MAQERYGFFNSTAEDERSYDSADMAAAFHTLAADGVADTGTCLQVTAEGGTMRTLAGYGMAMIRGFYYHLRDNGGAIQAFSHGTEAELDRIDRIVVRLDIPARTVALVKKIGVAASTPQAPTLTRGEEVYELSLAQVRVRAAAEEILESDITDERADDAVCGLIAPESLRLSRIAQMIENATAQGLAEGLADALRFSAQTLTGEQKAQGRDNIGAQAKITASGLLKGDGNGGATAGTPGTDYGMPAAEAAATLTAAGWAGTEAPFSQTVTVTGMTAGRKAVAGLSPAATGAQYQAAAKAQLRVTAQGTDTVTVQAEGEKPEVDLLVSVLMVG